MGFYISDFGLPSPFSTADFDRLVSSGEIVIGVDAPGGTSTR